MRLSKGSRAALGRRAGRIRLFPAVTIALLAGMAIAFIAYWFLRRITPVDVNKTAAEIDVTRVALTVVAGVGGVVALVIAYRRQRDLEQSRFVERFGAAAAQLGATDVAVRIAGVYAMAGVADESDGLRRQQCIDVLCGYLRLPYSPELGANHQSKLVLKHHRATADGTRADDQERHLEYRHNDREVRATIVRVIADHLRATAEYSWSVNDFDFRTAHFEDVDFSLVQFSGAARFAGATFSRIALFEKAAFHGPTEFHRVTFSGPADFSGVVFADDADFVEADFSTAPTFRRATFRRAARFPRAKFHGITDFSRAAFHGTAAFGRANFSGITDFNRATFANARFAGATFSEHTDFSKATFSGTAEFDWATFAGSTDLSEVVFAEATDFDFATFSERTDFHEATFAGPTRFREATFAGPISFAAADFGAARISFAQPKQWGPPAPVFDWNVDVSQKPANVEPQEWPPVVPVP